MSESGNLQYRTTDQFRALELCLFEVKERMMGLYIAIAATLAVIFPAIHSLFFAKKRKGESRKTLKRWDTGFLLSGVALSLAMTWAQYSNVRFETLQKQKILERDLAFSIWAYSQKNPDALQYLTGDSTSTADDFMLGYYYFEKDNSKDSKTAALGHLRQSIDKNEFVAPSLYIRAVMEQADDLDDAMKDVIAGLSDDPGYSSLYLEKAIIEANKNEPSDAIKDIDNAIKIQAVHCYTITNEKGPLYGLLDGVADFQRIITECKNDIDGIKRTINESVSTTQ